MGTALNQERICVIFAGGDLTGSVELPAGALIVCADSGLYHAQRLGITPDVIIGDFDSFTDSLPEGIPVLRLPVEKDVTDTMRAVQYGAEQGCRKFHIYGAFGGKRIDHSIATLQFLRWMYERGMGAILFHGSTVLSLQYGDGVPFRYPRFEGDFSLFSLTERCEGVTICGTKYDVEDITLKSSFPLGVSNTILADCAEITIQSGCLLVVQVRSDAPNA